MATAWSSSTKEAAITLSNGGLTALCASGHSYSPGACDTFITSGQTIYFEVHFDVLAQVGATAAGIANASTVYTVGNYLGVTNNSLAYFDDGTVIRNNATVATYSTPVVGDTIGVAVKGHDKVWFSLNGVWQSGNPNTLTGGIDISTLGDVNPAYSLVGTSTPTKITGNFGATTTAFAIPTGFSTFDGVVSGTITHLHVDALGDDATDLAAGKVVGSHWNAGHVFSLSKSDVGLSHVDNTSDATVLASAATAAAALYRNRLAADQTKNVPADFATLELALAYAATIDFNGHTLTIQLAAGTYSPSATTFKMPATVGQSLPSNLLIKGDAATPSNVILSATVGFAGVIEGGVGTRCRLQGIQFKGGGSTFGLHASGGGYIEYLNCDFNTGLFAAACSESGGSCVVVGGYTVSAGMTAVMFASNGGYSFNIGNLVTLTGTPAWIAGFAWADALSFIRAAGATFSGSATGPRYASQHNSLIDTSGGGASFFPGDSAGSTSSGGLYT